MINQERIKNLLLELVQIDSHSRKERDVAERIKKYCEEMGAQVEIDDAGTAVGCEPHLVLTGKAAAAPDQAPLADCPPGTVVHLDLMAFAEFLTAREIVQRKAPAP